MPKKQLSMGQVSSIVSTLERDYDAHANRLRIRRLLIEMGRDSVGDPDTGVHIPEPFNESKMIIRTLIGDVVDGVQHYAARVSANEPIVEASPVTGSGQRITSTVDDNAGEQERNAHGPLGWGRRPCETTSGRMVEFVGKSRLVPNIAS